MAVLSKIIAAMLGVAMFGPAMGAVSLAAAQSPIDGLAAAIVAASQPRWAGPRTPHPIEQARPVAAEAHSSRQLPLTLHTAVPLAALTWQRALTALEEAHRVFARDGWPLPPPDGGRAGGSAFDLYVLASAEEGASAYADAPSTVGVFDSVIVFAAVPAVLLQRDPAACAVDAYAQAMLLAIDPAEDEATRRATAAWLVWRLTGRTGCGTPSADGALWLRYLDGQISAGSGAVVRDLWQMTQQRTWDGDSLRASPNWWECLLALLRSRRQSLEALVEGFAMWRRSPPIEGTAAQLVYQVRDLPRRTPSLEVPPLGSAAVDIAWPAAAGPRQVRIWLRAEYGGRWSVAALRRDAAGRVLSQVTAAARDATASYLPVLLTPQTATVTVVVTHLLPPQAKLPSQHSRAFYLLLDR